VTPDKPADGRPGGPTDRLGWTGDSRWATTDRPVGAVVLVVALVPFWQLGGPAGVLAWLGVAGSWLLFPPVVPVALGQFLLVAVTPADMSLGALLPAEGALLALLGATFLDSGGWLPGRNAELSSRRQDLADAAGYLGAATALAAGAVSVATVAHPLLAGALCLGLLGAVAYGLRPVLTR